MNTASQLWARLQTPQFILAWGANYSGQLGNGNKNDQFLPVPVVGMNGIVSVRGGWMHSLASRGDATVWAWGNNGAGQLGNGTGNDSSTPVQVQGAIAEVYGSALAAGLHHSLAIGFKAP